MRLFGVLLAALVLPLAGCSISTDDHSETAPERTEQQADYSAELEAQITRQLPRKVRALSGPDAFVTGVRCVHQSASSYQCIANVSGTNAYTYKYEKTQLPIEGTCDERACIWKVTP